MVLASIALFFVSFSSLSVSAQYCTPTGVSPCSHMWISNVTLGSINNTTGCTGAYSDYTSMSTSLAPGSTYTITLRGAPYPQYASVFVDWNNDFDFDDVNELAASFINIPDNGTHGSGSITVPANATGSYRLRVVSDYQQYYTPNNSCGPLRYGEAEDYTVVICAGPPDGDGDGYTVCQGDCDDANPAIHPGATEIFGNNIDDNCDGLVDAVMYCTPTGDGGQCSNMWITNVTVGTINHSSGCSSGGYADYSALSTSLIPGSNYTISIRGRAYPQRASVFVDWNKDGDFDDANEVVATGVAIPDNGSPGSANFTVPVNATGSHRLRVITDYVDFYTPNNACYSGKYGEAEDYTVTTGTPCETPSITCPGPVAVSCASEVPSPDVTLVTASSNCDAPTVTWEGDVISNQTCTNWYIITRTYKATNSAGSSTCTQTITVNDQSAPGITCPQPVTVQCANDVPAPDVSSVLTSDNCGGTVTVSWEGDAISGQSCTNRYTVTRTYKATDACGNSSTCTQIINVYDDTKPAITCPNNITVAPTTLAGTVVNYPAPSATDNCGSVTVIQTAGKPSGSTFPIGTTTNTFEATDACGNTISCSFTVTVSNPYCDNNPNAQKVYVCHKGKTNCISVNALQAHMAQGAYLGPCSTSMTTKAAVTVEENRIEENALEVKVSPNPSATDFRMTVLGNSYERISIMVKDGAGRSVLSVTGVQVNSPLRIGSNLKTGIYFVEVMQGANRQVVKLVKIN